MSKISKFIVLLAGIVGVAAFFLPLASVKDSGFTGQLSAFQIVKGISSTQDVVGEAGKIVDSETDKAAVKDANEALSAVKGIVLACFAPAVFLLLFGGIGAAKRFGRGLGIGSLLFGLIGLGIWALLSAAFKETGAESAVGVAMHLLLVSGAGGALGGLMGTIKPEPKAEV